MSMNVQERNLRKSSLPRTGRTLDAVGGTFTSVSGGTGSSAGGVGEPINISINQGEGIEVDGSETSYTISHADTSDASNTENSDTYVIRNVLIDKFGHVTGFESGDVTTELDGRYIRKDIPDIDNNHLTLKNGLKVENKAVIDNLNVEETATTLNLIVKELAKTYDLDVEHVATIFRTIIQDFISSELFIPGFTGSGMKLYQALNGDWNLELDNLTVRKIFNVFELVIQKIRSINGALVISQSNGTIESVTDMGDYYQLSFNDEYPTFVVGDFLRCQVFAGRNMKYYWVTVDSVDGSSVNVLKSEFEGAVPAAGDEIVQIGNDRDPARQSVIYLSASEDGKPKIDILAGINTKSFAGKIMGRFGCLDNITDTDFPADYQPSGYGLYSINCFLKGIFILRNGKSIETELSALEGQIKLAVTWDSYNNTITGSKNLFLDTKNMDNPAIWDANTGVFSASLIDGFRSVAIVGNWCRAWQFGKFKPDRTYTLTCFVKRDPANEGAEPSRFSFFTDSKVETLYCNFENFAIVPTEWTRLIWTFKTPSDHIPDMFNPYIPRLEFACYDWDYNTPYVLLYGYMVVEGDRAASWSPAPEDVEANTREYTNSQIAVAKGEIDLSVTTKINNVKMGVRNLLMESNVPATSNIGQYPFYDYVFGKLLEIGKTYTIVANGHVSSLDATLAVFPNTGYNAPVLINSITDITVSETFVCDSNFRIDNTATCFCMPLNVNATATVNWVVIVEGNKAPDSWTSSVEEMASQKELQSGIKILQDSVNTKVSETTFDELDRKVSTVESQVLVNTEGITQTVEKVNAATQLAMAMAGGEMMYSDPTFEEGMNGISAYNNLLNGNVVVSRTSLVYDVPNRAGYCLVIKTNGPASPYQGGFTFLSPPLANAVYVVRFIALIPIGYTVNFFTNNLGINSHTEWLTSNIGIGDWQEYGIKIKYGTGSDLGSTCFFALDGPATYPITPIEWYLSYATVFNITNAPATATKTQIRQLGDRIDLSATSINELTGRVNQAEIALKPDNIFIGLKDKIKIGGTNTFSYLNTRLDVYNNGSVTRLPDKKGFLFAPSSAATNLRIPNVITSKGYWTMSFDFSLESGGGLLNVDFCDNAAPPIAVKAGHVIITIDAVNQGNSPIYNFIDISGLNSGTYYFSNVKVEQGNIPTAWSPNPADQPNNQELLDTGIDIKNRKIVVTADTFKLQDNSGSQIALFTNVGGKPKVIASNIDVDNLNVKLLDGATGSFRDLYCKNSSGQNVGRIHFGTDASMWFDGNMYHQSGLNSNPRFYAADIWCRGNFGTYMNAVVQVNDGAATYYTNGYSYSGQWKGLESKISANGVGYHPIPLVLQEGNGIAFSPEMVLINSSVVRYYELVGLTTKKVVVINVHKTVPCYIFCNGNAVNLQGGHLREFYCVKGFLNPTGSTTRVGYGWMAGADSVTDF